MLLSVDKRGMFLASLLAMLFIMASCTPAVAPTPTPTKAPAAATSVPAEATKPSAAAPTPKPASVKFGAIPSSGFAGVYLGVEKGHFKEQAIDMQMTAFRTVQELVAPLGTGQLDVIAMAVTPALLAAADRGVEFKIVASTHDSRPGNEYAWVVLRKDLKDSGEVKSVADLKGKKISIMSQGGTADQVAQVLIEQAGLKPSDVETVVLSAADSVVALGNKAIAAAVMGEPYVTVSVQQGSGEKWLPFSPTLGGPVTGGVVAFGPSMTKDPDLARRWLIAYLKGSRDYLKAMKPGPDQEQLFSVLDKYSPIPDRKLFGSIQFPYVDPNGAILKKSIDTQYNWWVAKGIYTGKTTFDAVEDLSYLDYAVQKLGKQ